MPVVGAGVAAGAYLESDYPTQARQGRPLAVKRPPRPVPPRPPARPAHANETARLLDRVQVHPAVRVGGLTVFPLTARPERPWSYGELLTLSEGLSRGVVEVRELDNPTVERARFVNRSDAYVFVMGGELILGGKQNRTVRQDALLAPHSEAMLPLYCVQQGRWDQSASTFKRSPACLPLELRDLAAQNAGQSAVWDEVRKSNRQVGVQSETEDFQAGLDAPNVKAELDRCRRRILPALPHNCIGVVVARHGRIVGADLFVDASLFGKLRSKVLDSYAYGIIGCRVAPRRRHPTPADAKRFLDHVYRSRFDIGPVWGVGRVRLIRGIAHGNALAYDEYCLHLNLVGNPVFGCRWKDLSVRACSPGDQGD